jgi:hypothetical protein
MKRVRGRCDMCKSTNSSRFRIVNNVEKLEFLRKIDCDAHCLCARCFIVVSPADLVTAQKLLQVP